tara:strand:+ start:8749 stop:9141 length:393 start_codon:yes stop_codon:yes gene_type:complete
MYIIFKRKRHIFIKMGDGLSKLNDKNDSDISLLLNNSSDDIFFKEDEIIEFFNLTTVDDVHYAKALDGIGDMTILNKTIDDYIYFLVNLEYNNKQIFKAMKITVDFFNWDLFFDTIRTDMRNNIIEGILN